ncbi:hypothetical protein EOL70_06280 [Leucothrix sargassi]|nr:hypothetical protein EOL70_06280 [Leucothrix sargassi]
MKLRHVAGCLLSAVLIQGCNAGPETTKPANTPTGSTPTNPIPSGLNSVKQKDQYYAERLVGIQSRDAVAEAQQALAKGAPNVLGYYSGRAGLKVPSFTAEQQAKQRCKLNTIEGMGDVIYGENHMKYRIAMRDFAKTYNSQMLAVCL